LVAGLGWLAEWMQRHNLTVSMESDSDTIALPQEQSLLLFQSVRELLINTAKHAQCARAWLTVTSAPGALRVTVRDEGAGFEPVRAMEGSSEPSSKFGLFSIRERMTALGGSLDIDTAPGRGTTSVLRLPYSQGLAEPRERLRARPEPAQSSDARPTRGGPVGVILVDDHAMIREGLRAVLANYADIVLLGEAADGEAGVALVRHVQPSVVIMDINMPRLNGIEATARIKEQFPHVVVIGLSVNADSDNQDAMKQAGAARLLTKEAAVNELYQAIHAELNWDAVPSRP
jgi:CheY-like chemotaxis protein